MAELDWQWTTILPSTWLDKYAVFEQLYRSKGTGKFIFKLAHFDQFLICFLFARWIQCMQHGWYLASDFQLTIVGSIIQMIIWKVTKLTKTVFSVSLIISMIIPAALTYVNGFEGAFMATPEYGSQFLIYFYVWIIVVLLHRITRYAHWFSEQYHSIYIPFYGNLTSFLFGMIGGILYCRHKQGHIDLTKSKVWIFSCRKIIWINSLFYSIVVASVLVQHDTDCIHRILIR